MDGADITAPSYSDLNVPDELGEETQSEKSSDENDTEEDSIDDDEEKIVSKNYEGFDLPYQEVLFSMKD